GDVLLRAGVGGGAVAIEVAGGLGVLRPVSGVWRPPARGLVVVGTGVRQPFGSGAWDGVYGPAAGGPVDHGAPPAQVAGPAWSAGFLAPGTWSFGVRAEDGFGVEWNLDCALTIVIDADGRDVTDAPAPVAAVRALATAGGGVRVEWLAPPVRGPR